MKHAGAFSLALILGSMTVLAQNSGRNGTQPTVARVISGSTNCPVEMRAQWQFGHKWLQKVPSSSNQPPAPGRGIKLTLTNSTFSEIVEVQVTAYGLNSKPQLSLGQATSAGSAIDKTVDLKLNVGPKSEASAVLFLPGFTSVTLVNVDSIHYAGGSTWHPSALHTCHVIPDLAMLISRR